MTDLFAHKAPTWDNPVKIDMTQHFVARLRKNETLKPDDVVMEVGCGTGLVGLQLKDSVGRLTMVDNSKSMLDVLMGKISADDANKIEIVHGDIEDVAGEHRFDWILAFMVLHHVYDTESFFATAKKLLQQQGKLIIGDLYSEDGSFHGKEKMPHNGFDIESLKAKLINAGFNHVSDETLMTLRKRDRDYDLFYLAASI